MNSSSSAKELSLTANDISYIVNLICPNCGGPLGGRAEAFRCQGQCRRDWRPAWRENAPKQSRTNGSLIMSEHTPVRRHPWRGRKPA